MSDTRHPHRTSTDQAAAHPAHPARPVRTPRTPTADDGRLAEPTAGQQRLWVLSQSDGANEAYNETLAFTLRGPLDRAALGRALDGLVARHEVLRTRLVATEGGVHQLIGPPDSGYTLAMDDLTRLPDAATRVTALQHAEAATPFDLARGPLARGRLIALAEHHHVLLLTLHHAVFDGWSMNVMLRELGTLYTAFRDGAASPLPPLPLQYADYARRQREWESGDEPAAQAAYWREALAGAPTLLELPTDHPRPPVQDHRGGRVPVALDGELGAALKALARQQGGTLFSAVLAGWSVVLSRLTGQRDVVIGVPTANRHRGAYSDLIGFFVNSLAVRVDLSDSPTGSAVLKQVRGTLRDALKHQDLPFEQVVELVNPPRSTAHPPLFQTMVAWQPSRRNLLDLPGIEAEPLAIPYAGAKFDLALSLSEEDDGRVVGHLDYAGALFDHATAERYAGYLHRVLTGLVDRPDLGVDDLELMDEAERRRVLSEWSGADRAHRNGRAVAGDRRDEIDETDGTDEPTAPAGLVERFQAQVRTRPTAPALVREGERLDYATLGRRVNRLAHALIARGVGPDQVVGLHCGRSTELVVGVLGILTAGAAYLPLDPGQPVERLAAMVEDAAPALVLSDTDDPTGSRQSLRGVEAEAHRDDAPGTTAGPKHLAYVIYTSGSTGRPKGVAVTRGSVTNLFDTWLARFGATPGEAVSAWSSIGFDASVHELLLPLTTGAVLHLVPDDLRGDPGELLAWMREHRIVQAFLPPSYVKWIDEDPQACLDGLALRQLLTGVESLPEKALHRIRQALPGLRICYGYGPTEATLYSTAYTDPQPLDRQCPIGRPLDNTRLYLLDRRLRPVPTGVAGEVHLGGASLARGYLHRPDLTAERFVDDPFVPGERLYRTGDLARWLPDGNAQYLGRSDDQVKLRGFRIEPGEVEAALLALPGVHEAAVLADRDAAGELRLVAGLGRGDAQPRPPHEWRAALSRRLPDYMIPALFVELPHLPLNRSGKLDRAALLTAARAATHTQVNTASPRDHVEMALHTIWRRVLLHPGIGISDNFFDLGGTSLSAIKVALAVREEFGETLPIRDIVQNPTIEALAERLRAGASGAPDGNLVEFRAGDGRQRVVCVHPAGGTAFCYLPLAAALPDQVGVLGVQSPGINPGETPLPTVEAMAEHYLSLVDPRPDESLVLCGLSYGGLVAHEMGRRLALAGHTRLSVVMLDTHGTEDAEELAAIEPVDMADFRDKLIRFNGMYPGIEDEQIDRYFRIYNHNRMTARDYRAQPTAARLVLVEAAGDGTGDGTGDGSPEQDESQAEGQAQAQTQEQAGDVRAFWTPRAGGGLLVEPVACGHWDLLESAAVPRIAALITAELDRVPGSPPPSPSPSPVAVAVPAPAPASIPAPAVPAAGHPAAGSAASATSAGEA
ncbi:amino acid adenylation domain-containing protein [Kitasatospora sp. NPDC059599]|uniref:non-ribosomal peptide synthetase n=1 Tax=Kitasatospora sp. NPDC059599 TaxID=3346880 RepID=UPI0036C727CE